MHAPLGGLSDEGHTQPGGDLKVDARTKGCKQIELASPLELIDEWEQQMRWLENCHKVEVLHMKSFWRLTSYQVLIMIC